MAQKTKTGKIPSIEVDKGFFEKLGFIIEEEIKSRAEEGRLKSELEIKEKNTEIESRTYYSNDREKNQAKEDAREFIIEKK